MASDETTRQLRRAEYLRQYFADTGRAYSTGANIHCPNATVHAHGDANASAKIYENPDGALVKCYGCGGAWDIFGLWQLDNGGTFAEAKAALCERFNMTRTPSATNASRATQTSGGGGAVRAFAGLPVAEIGTAQAETAERTRTARPDRQTADYLTTCAMCLTAGTEGEAGRAYLKGRGISLETARRFGIGYDPQAGWTDGKRGGVTIPNGAGYTVRFLCPQTHRDGGEVKAMFLPRGADRPLFNIRALGEAAKNNAPVFIVEGEIDALSVAEVGGVAVSTGGTSGARRAVAAVSRIGRGVYVPCMDRDEHGEKAQAELVAKLREIGGAVYVYDNAPVALMPDAPDGSHPKDANEALQTDAAAFRAAVADVIERAKKYAAEEEAKHRPFITLAELADPPPEDENPRALFRRGYLRKGGGLIAASVAGAGKSTFSLQCALHWVLGVPCFGIDPVRPLKVAVIQAEDDAEELAMFRANMRQGLAAEGLTLDQIGAALERLHIRTDFVGKTGADFASALGTMQSRYHYDLVVVNPLNSYFDGDISLNKDASEFFRKLIDPIIKNPATECGIVFIHHMSKPAKGKDAATFGKGAYAQYSIQGGAELNNWARSVLLLTPFDCAPDFWTLTAAKRYKPLAWKDESGKDTKDKVIAYSPNFIYWREPSAAEIAAAREGVTVRHETEDERKQREDAELRQALKEIVDYLARLPEPINQSALYSWCDRSKSTVFKGFHSHTVKNPKTGANYPKRPCYLAYELIKENPLQYGVGYHVGKYKNGKEYHLYGGGAPVEFRAVATPVPMAADTAATLPDTASADYSSGDETDADTFEVM